MMKPHINWINGLKVMAKILVFIGPKKAGTNEGMVAG